MNARDPVRLVVRTLTAGVLLASATYLMVYLYRWEWNRALISGVFFLAAEIAVVTSLLFARLARLERRLDGTAPAAPAPTPGPVADVARESPFAWLDPASGRLGVFVPLLMGAGVILSAIAFVVEKLSASVARAGATRRELDSVGPPLPAGGLLAAVEPPPLATPRRRGPSSATVLLVAGVVLLVPAIDFLGDATQTRPDPSPDHTTVTLDVWVRGARDAATERAAALPVACKGRIRLDQVDVAPAGPDRARLVVSGVMDEYGRRKFTGCLQDATLDGIRAVVVAMSTRPPDAPVEIVHR